MASTQHHADHDDAANLEQRIKQYLQKNFMQATCIMETVILRRKVSVMTMFNICAELSQKLQSGFIIKKTFSEFTYK